MINMVKEKINVSELKEGDIFESGEYTISKEESLEFAKQYDPQEFHVDSELAKESIFGELITSGWHTAAITMRLWVESTNIEHGLVGSKVNNMNWSKPVKPGDTLRVVGKVTSLNKSKSDSNRVNVGLHNQTLDQDGDVVLEYDVKLVGFIEL